MQKKIKDPSRWADQQIQGSKNGAQNWLDGIKNPSRDPIQASIAAEGKYQDAMKRAMAENRRVKGLQGVSHADIVKTAEKLGPSVYEQGISSREDKIRKSIQELQPKLQAVSDAVQALPDTTEADRERRMIENLKRMRKIAST